MFNGSTSPQGIWIKFLCTLRISSFHRRKCFMERSKSVSLFLRIPSSSFMIDNSFRTRKYFSHWDAKISRHIRLWKCFEADNKIVTMSRNKSRYYVFTRSVSTFFYICEKLMICSVQTIPRNPYECNVTTTNATTRTKSLFLCMCCGLLETNKVKIVCILLGQKRESFGIFQFCVCIQVLT